MEMDFRFESVNGLAKALGGRIDLLEKIFGKKVRDNLKYSDIQKIVKSGFASEFFDLGDEIMTKYTATDGTVYDFPWRIVDFRDVYWENDPIPHPGMVLQGKYATAEQLAYDIDSFDWSLSSLRQWLNSDAEQGNWWTSTYDGDTAPTELDTYNGFMHGFDEEFLNSLKTTRVSSMGDSDHNEGMVNGVINTYDKFYIASGVEMYSYSEGHTVYEPNSTTYFEYWRRAIGSDKPTNGPHATRIFRSIDDITKAIIVALRSGMNYAGMGYFTFTINIDGSANCLQLISSSYHVLPYCVIS